MLSCFHIITDSGQWEIDTHGFLVVDSNWKYILNHPDNPGKVWV